MSEEETLALIKTESKDCNYCHSWGVFMYKQWTSVPHVVESRSVKAGEHVLHTKNSDDNGSERKCASVLVKEWIEKLKENQLSVEAMLLSCKEWIHLPNHYIKLSTLFEKIEFRDIHYAATTKEEEVDTEKDDDDAEGCSSHTYTVLPNDLDQQRRDLNDHLFMTAKFALKEFSKSLSIAWSSLRGILGQLQRLDNIRHELMSISGQFENSPFSDVTTEETATRFFYGDFIPHLRRIEAYTEIMHNFHAVVKNQAAASSMLESDIDVLVIAAKTICSQLAVGGGSESSYHSLLLTFMQTVQETLDPRRLLTSDVIMYMQTLMVEGETAETQAILHFDKHYTETNAHLAEQTAALVDKYTKGARAGDAVLDKVPSIERAKKDPLLELLNAAAATTESNNLINLDTDDSDTEDSSSDTNEETSNEESAKQVPTSEESVDHHVAAEFKHVVGESNVSLIDMDCTAPASTTSKVQPEQEDWINLKPNGGSEHGSTRRRYEKRPMRGVYDDVDWELEKPDVLKEESSVQARFVVPPVKKPKTPPGLIANDMNTTALYDQYQEAIPDELDGVGSDMLVSIVRHLHLQNDTLIQLILQLKEEMSMMTSQYVEVIRYHREKEIQTLDLFEKSRKEELQKIKDYVLRLEARLKGSW